MAVSRLTHSSFCHHQRHDHPDDHHHDDEDDDHHHHQQHHQHHNKNKKKKNTTTSKHSAMCGLKARGPWIKTSRPRSSCPRRPYGFRGFAGTSTDTCAVTAGSAYNGSFDGASASGGGGRGSGGGDDDDDSSLETALGGTLLMSVTIVLFMKLVSDAHVNLD